MAAKQDGTFSSKAAPTSSLPDARAPVIEIRGDHLIIKSSAFFAGTGSLARNFLERAFLLDEVRAAVLNHRVGSIGLTLDPLAQPGLVLKRLGALLRQPPAATARLRLNADRLPLEAQAPGLPVRVTRLGNTLTTFRARALSVDHIRIAHPLLRVHGIRQRVFDLLRSVHGVTQVRAAALRREGITVTYDEKLISAERLLRVLDDSWPHISRGPKIAAPPKKLAVAASLLALSLTAQFFRATLLPWATAAVVLYQLPNVFAAIRDLQRRKVGVPAMSTMGFGFLLWSRLPFVASLFATFAQAWPALADSLALRSERRLFAAQRKRLTWARLTDTDAGEIEIDIATLKPGMSISVRKGDYIPADGTVLEGFAALDDNALTGARGAIDKFPGDPVYAGAHVTDGALRMRVTRAGHATSSAALARALPHGKIADLPSAFEVQRIGDRNAKPAMVGASLLLLATRASRLPRVMIRPDYVTAPRLSVHLSALTAVAEALAAGALIRTPAALDRIRGADICVLDDSVDLSRSEVRVADIKAENSGLGRQALALAAAALERSGDARQTALGKESARLQLALPRLHDIRRFAGALFGRDNAGSAISIMAPAIALHHEMRAPPEIARLLRAEADRNIIGPELRAIAVARGRDILALIRFERSGTPRIAQTIAALRQKVKHIRFVHLSSAPQDAAEAHAGQLHLDAVFGGLRGEAKVEAMRSMGAGAIWLGNGADAATAAMRVAAAVSISTAGLATLAKDSADIVLLRGDTDALLATYAAAERRLQRLEADKRLVYLANLSALAGGFSLGFNSLHAGLTSNLGTAAVFLARWRSLKGLDIKPT